MQKFLLFGLVAASLSFQACKKNGEVVIPEGIKLIEKVERTGDELVIPYSKYQLDNGLMVIIHEDHSDPIVHVDVTYHVGSAREEPMRSGFAHFFEHMMFQGSDNVADEEHFAMVSEAGGNLNGTTNADRTNYFETLPSNQLETALWLEADRMGFLLDAVTQKKFEVQRATVKNERGQNYDNRPYGLVREKVAQALYPQTHPYHWPTIGYLEDLDRVDVNDLKQFFLRWYGPNNATLTVAGAVDQSEVLALVKKYYGSIPRGAEVARQQPQDVTLTADRYISYEDNIRFPLLMVTFPTVPNYHADEAPLDVLSDILGGSKSSLFYKNFEKAQLAIQAGVSHPCQELGGYFNLTVLPYPGKTLVEMEKLIRATLVEFEETGVSDEALERFKSTYESGVISGLETVSGKASQLAQYEFMLGNPNRVAIDLARYKAVTKEDVMRVYEKYIKGRPAVILSVYPKGQPQLVAAPDNFVYLRDTTITPDLAQYEGLTYVKPTKEQDGFDRSQRPPSGPNPTIEIPDFWRADMDNGLSVIGAKNNEIPKVYLRLALRTGHRYTDIGKAGIADLFASMMAEKTQDHTAEELDSELEKLGSSINVYAGSEEIYINVSSLTKNLDRTMQLLEEVMFRPMFSEEEFNRKKFEQMESIANQVNVPTTLADNQYGKVLYGDGHIMSVPSIGTAASLGSVTLMDIQQFYEDRFVPNITNLVIVGDVEQKDIMPKLAFLTKWEKKEVQYPEELPTPAAGATKIYLVDKPGAAQSELRMGYLSMPYDATGEYFRTYATNFALGGSFNSRVNLNLREDKGWTYGAFSYLSGTKHIGPYTAQAGVKKEATDSALVEFIREFKEFAENGVTEEELSFTKNSIGQQDALKYEAGYQKTGFLSRILTYGLDKDFTEQQNSILQAMTKEDMDALAKKHVDVSRMAIVVVGDKASIYEGLSKLPYEIEVVNFPMEVAR
ncbi:MAG: insulinase family protein [Flavobacteriales bacterium]|nr:insulinase family protein [Flavobacteriales bacterium]